jgi:hypothetical protein
MADFSDCTKAETRRLQEFDAYISEVDSIFQFRYFKRNSFYELIEIPVELMKPILDVPRNFYSSDGPSISIPVGNEVPDFTLKLDRSDAKITIASIRKERCVVHATWQF